MRIPLDYYRVLGVPIQATDQQLGQAHRDRALQLPRREYSDAAIDARKQLIDEAYSVLSDPEQRAQYDAQFLTKTYESEAKSSGELARSEPEGSGKSERPAPTPWIEIEDHQFVGALLILLELGEYELVVKLGQPFLENRQAQSEDTQIIRADIVLTVALACLELGREQWQHGQSENAALSGQMGQDLLLREGLFPNIRGEIQADLYRLRPYRILELLALSETDSLKRRKGMQILREMLNERGGIDGSGDDRSGLNVDDFLRFIQQIRNYLTAAEQQELFEGEARRPSAVATYLAVYALIARGFAEGKPVLITRAREFLQRLSKRQDVYLEQSVCALLLGQPEEASRALELSQESEPLSFIREHSQDSPDLLPGLCLYGEQWLQSEVFPHFRDLAVQQASLKDYFADEQVQAYLEQLPVEGSRETQALEVKTLLSQDVELKSGEAGTTEKPYAEVTARGEESTVSRNGAMTATVERPSSGNLATLSRDSIGHTALRAIPPTPETDRKPRRSRRDKTQPPIPLGGDGSGERPAVRGDRGNGRSRPSPKIGRLLLLLGAVGLLLWALGALIRSLIGTSAPSGLAEGQPQIELTQPPVEIPPRDAQIVIPDGQLSEEGARQIVVTWLSVKSEALGSDHNIEQLNSILANPALSTWRANAQRLEQNNAYREYQHSVKVESFKTDEENPNAAIVEAAVNEVAKAYQNGQHNPAASYDDNLRVRYSLVRQGDRWLIDKMQVLE